MAAIKLKEPEIRPEYLKKLKRLRKGKYIKYNSIEELRKIIEMDKNLKEDLIFAQRTDAAFKKYEKGKFTSLDMEDFLKQLRKK